jgi:hypothetical protein
MHVCCKIWKNIAGVVLLVASCHTSDCRQASMAKFSCYTETWKEAQSRDYILSGRLKRTNKEVSGWTNKGDGGMERSRKE